MGIFSYLKNCRYVLSVFLNNQVILLCPVHSKTCGMECFKNKKRKIIRNLVIC